MESYQQTMVQIIDCRVKSIGVAIITPETNIFLNLLGAQHFKSLVSDSIHTIFFRS